MNLSVQMKEAFRTGEIGNLAYFINNNSVICISGVLINLVKRMFEFHDVHHLEINLFKLAIE